MQAKSIKGQSTEEISIRLKEATADGFEPTLAIVFLSISQDRSAICKLLDEERISIFGATTAGEFIDGDVSEGSTVVMLLDLDKSFFKLHFTETDNDGYDKPNKIGLTGEQIFSNPEFIVAVAGFGSFAEMVVEEIQGSITKTTTIFGGVAGDDNTGTGAYIFTNDKQTQRGSLLLIIDADKVVVKGLATSGWKPVGTVRTITKSEGNVVHTIDGMPALDVFMKYLDDTPSDLTLMDDTQVLANNEYYPILLQRNGEPSIVRAAIRTDAKKRTVHFAGKVPEGSSFRFTLPPDFNFIEQVIAHADTELKAKQILDADALILFSCASRKGIFGPMISEDIDGLKNLWGAPLVGFFCYGEIGKISGGKHELHNNTCCLVALKEVSTGK